MSGKNHEYIIGEFKVAGRKGKIKGATTDVRKRLKNYLEKANLGNCTQLTVEDNKILIYGDPTMGALKGFEEQNNDKGGIQVRFIPYTLEGIEDSSSLSELEHLRTQYNDLQKNYQSIEKKRARSKKTDQGLRSRVRTAELRLEKEKQDRSELEIEYLEALEKIDSLEKQKFIEIIESGDLEKVLNESDDAHLSRQEDLIEKVFYQIFDEIEGRNLYEKSEELKKAKKTIEDRDLYLKEQGEDSLARLPEEARKLTEEKWKEAEEIINKTQEEFKPLEIPLRIAETKDGIMIEMPINPKSGNEVSRKLYETLLTYGAFIQDEFDLNVSQVEGSFATLNLGGEVDYNTTEYLMQAFEEVAEITGINIKPFKTNYFLIGHEKEVPKEVDKEVGSLSELIKRRLEELGYKNQKQFAINNNIPPGTLYPLTSGHSNPGPELIEKLAKALKISSSEITDKVK